MKLNKIVTGLITKNVIFNKSLVLISISFYVTVSGQNLTQASDSIIKTNNIPAIVYAILKSDTILEINVLGLQRIDRKNHVTINSRFHLGSNSKAITAFIAANLVEHKKLKWDTRFFDLFPELLLNANKAYSNITLCELLSHRARIQPFTSGKEFLELTLKDSANSRKLQFAEFVLKQNPQNVEKNKIIYSNAGYALATMMMEKVSGKSYATLINEILNGHLNLNVSFGWPNSIDSSQTFGHQGQSWGFETIQPLTDTNGYKIDELIVSAGDINMTLPSYSKFIQLFLKGIKGTDSFLKSETYNYLLFGLPEYSLGWSNGLKENRYFATHDGSGGTFYCHTVIVKKLDLAIIIVTNSAEEKTVAGIHALEQVIKEKYGN
jgi:D-alanyl-D-alanine carboxypeptidase